VFNDVREDLDDPGQRSGRRKRHRRPSLLSAGIAILIAADIFFALYTPIYARLTPKLGDFPFFYW